MLGQPASWQTVCSPSRWTRPRTAVNSGPIVALILIHGGLRSIGVAALRASMRSIRRPSGATCPAPPGAGERSVVTVRAYAGVGPLSGEQGRYATDVTYRRRSAPVAGTGRPTGRCAYGQVTPAERAQR